MEKNKTIYTRATFVDTDPKKNSTTVYFTQEQGLQLLEEITAKAENPDGFGITLYVNTRTNTQTGDSFKSTNVIVKSGSKKQGGANGGNGGGYTKNSFKAPEKQTPQEKANAVRARINGARGVTGN
ncbi:MAG TPA: hypothetical protein VM095_08490 [Pyrinomonadaceae bacterium]|nr:hypothetical protein [Pyrinomonadaceae bacterium]